MNEWNDLFVASAGASAALTGLLFVGVSFSLSKILSLPTLPTRALLSLTLLLGILIHSILFLIPQQSNKSLGIEILVLGSIVWIAVTRMDIYTIRKIEKSYLRQQFLNMVIDQLALLPYIIGGITIIISGRIGVYWIVPAIIFSFIKSVVDAWVLLVEIHR